jgi:tetratricopeptide (TPR) repeat protein
VPAKQSYEQALQFQQALGQKGDAAYSQISLAGLALEEKKPEDAKKLAQEAVTELTGEKDVGGEAQGRGTLALALLNLGDIAGARTQIEQATSLEQQATDRNLKLMTAIAKARIDAASGKNEEALKGLASVEKQARAAGLVAIEFEARLALGEGERKAGRTAKARATLTALAQEAILSLRKPAARRNKQARLLLRTASWISLPGVSYSGEIVFERFPFVADIAAFAGRSEDSRD